MQSTPTQLKQSSGLALIAGALIAASGIVRVLSYSTVTSDYTYFLAKWFGALQAHPGLAAFQTPFSDYAPLYLYLLKLLTYLPVYSLWSIKTLTLLFEVAGAVAVYYMLKATTHYSRDARFLCAAILLSLPTAILNDSLWGQSDALYALGIVLSLFSMLLDKPRYAALSFALAFAFKVQSIFFAPVLLGYFWSRKKDWKELLWIPAAYVVIALPALFSGASLSQTLFVYARQSAEYKYLNVSSPSIFAFTDGLELSAQVQNVLFWVGIALSLLSAAAIGYIVSRLPRKSSALLFWGVVCVIAVPYFLPRMHERYFYLADILSTLYALYSPRRWFVPVLVVGASLLSYMPFLSGQVSLFAGAHVNLRIPSFMLLVALLALLSILYTSVRRRGGVSYEHANDETAGEGGGRRGHHALSLPKAGRV